MPNFLAGQTKASNGPNKELQLYLKDKKELRANQNQEDKDVDPYI
jgi:hypothetical protein